MVKPIPDKYVRKAIFTALNDMIVVDQASQEAILLENVDSSNIDVGTGLLLASSPFVNVPCFDSRVPTDNTKNHYILMSSQTNEVNKYTKCGSAYESTILLDIITSYYGVGNTGSRLLADNILDKVRELTNDLVLDDSSGLVVHRQTQNFPSDIATITPSENIFRKFLRLEMFIN